MTILSRIFLAAFLATSVLHAETVTLNFEGFPDSTILTNQYPGLTFSNTIILTAGVSLNELEFPPYSGSNIASDNGGPISIVFSTPVTDFSGYFTYAEPVTIAALDAANNPLATATSLFSNNEAISGDPSSIPNELLQVSSTLGISSLTITGDPAGGSFALDNASYTTPSVGVPEPSYLTSWVLLGCLVWLSGLVCRSWKAKPKVQAAG